LQSDRTPALLSYLGELLGADPVPAGVQVLHEVARHFAARGAGTAYLTETCVRVDATAWTDADRPTALSWQNNIGALRLLATHGAPAPFEDDGGSWLIWLDTHHSSADGVAVLWLNDAANRNWSAQDTAALALTGQTLRRAGLLGPASASHVESRLDQGATVASRLSHDFGNLLTGVLGFTELALAQVEKGSRAHGYLQEVWGVACGGADWLKKLNYFCRRNPPEFTPTGLPGALAEEEARLGAAARPAWQADIAADLPALACDGESLREALRQVLDNAREAGGGEPVQLTARAIDLHPAAARSLIGRPAPGRYVEVTVSDRGSGMSEDVRARLFHEWFFSSKPRHRGMGLMVVYGIVHRFGGGLAIDCVPGRGTQVRLYFPAAPDPILGGPARLLIVDDDPQVLAEAQRILEPAGYRVETAGSPAEAVVMHQTAQAPFDVVLIAAHLPNLSGVELARRMLLRDAHVRFLFLHMPSGPALPRDELVNPATLVHKPLAGPALLQTIAAVLRLGRRPAPG
jgi:signal transduction histidine kinase